MSKAHGHAMRYFSEVMTEPQWDFIRAMLDGVGMTVRA